MAERRATRYIVANIMRRSIKKRAENFANRRIREGNVDRKMIKSLNLLKEILYNHYYGEMKLERLSNRIEEEKLKGTLLGIEKDDYPEEVVRYYIELKHQLVILLKSPEIHNSNYEMIKILACLDVLCENTKELKKLLNVRKKDGKLYTYVSILEVYNEKASLEEVLDPALGETALTDTIVKFIKAFEASEK